MVHRPPPDASERILRWFARGSHSMGWVLKSSELVNDRPERGLEVAAVPLDHAFELWITRRRHSGRITRTRSLSTVIDRVHPIRSAITVAGIVGLECPAHPDAGAAGWSTAVPASMPLANQPSVGCVRGFL